MKFDLNEKTWTLTIKFKDKAESDLFFEYFRLGTEAHIKKIDFEQKLQQLLDQSSRTVDFEGNPCVIIEYKKFEELKGKEKGLIVRRT